MIIQTEDNKILFDSEMYEMPNYWPFKLLKAVFGDTLSYLNANIHGIFEAVNDLTDPEKTVIVLRFKDGMTLDAIGKELNLSGERIRQIEARALRKLRHPKRSRKMISVSRYDFNELQKKNEELTTKLDIAGVSLNNLNVYKIRLEDLDLSVKTFNCLKRLGLNTVAYIVIEPDLLNIRSLGKYARMEIIQKLEDFGITYQDSNDQ